MEQEFPKEKKEDQIESEEKIEGPEEQDKNLVKPEIQETKNTESEPIFEKDSQKPEEVSQKTSGYTPDEEEREEEPKETSPTIPSQKKDTDKTIKSSQLKAERDEENIAKPWVDEAERIIKEHKNDPHTEDDEEAELQAKYLKERFGRDVKKPKD